MFISEEGVEEHCQCGALALSNQRIFDWLDETFAKRNSLTNKRDVNIGVASLVVAYGLFKGKSWAWLVAVVLSSIGVVVNVISLVTGNMGAIAGALVGIAINAIVLYYLSRRNVRQYFGKVAAARESSSTTVGI